MVKECHDEVTKLRIRVEDEYVRKEDMAHTVMTQIGQEVDRVMLALKSQRNDLNAAMG